MSCGRVNRREAKKAETRAALARAALALAVELGPDGVTVERISEAAGVSPRTFFNHFESKEDAILDFDVDGFAEIGEAIRSRPDSETPIEAIRAVFLETVPSHHDDPREMASRMALCNGHPGLQSRMLVKFGLFEDNVSEAFADRLGVDPSEDPRPRMIAAAVLAAVRTASMHALEHTGEHDVVKIADAVFGIFDASLGFAEPPPS